MKNIDNELTYSINGRNIIDRPTFNFVDNSKPNFTPDYDISKYKVGDPSLVKQYPENNLVDKLYNAFKTKQDNREKTILEKVQQEQKNLEATDEQWLKNYDKASVMERIKMSNDWAASHDGAHQDTPADYRSGVAQKIQQDTKNWLETRKEPLPFSNDNLLGRVGNIVARGGSTEQNSVNNNRTDNIFNPVLSLIGDTITGTKMEKDKDGNTIANREKLIHFLTEDGNNFMKYIRIGAVFGIIYVLRK